MNGNIDATPDSGRDLDAFQRRLLAELTQVASRSSAQPGSAGTEASAVRPARRRPMRIAAAIAGVAAAATAISIALSSVSAPPAFAVQTQPDGDITVTVNQFRDPDQLAQLLAKHGARVKVGYLTAPVVSQSSGPATGEQPPGGGDVTTITVQGPACDTADLTVLAVVGQRSFTIPRQDLTAGRTLLIAPASGEQSVDSAAIVPDAAVPCFTTK